MRGLLPCKDHGQCLHLPKHYGCVKLGGRSFRMNRVAYAEANGLDVATMGGVVLHSCDNPRCIEPAHLSLGTYADNSADMVDKGRQWVPEGELNTAAILTEEQVRYIRAVYKPRCRTYGCRALGRALGVDNHTVSDIVTHKTWRHLT